MTTVAPILRAEGAAALVAALVVWAQLDANWLLFAVLLLAPDVSMLGYLRGPALGSLTYNLVHNWALGLGAIGLGWALATPWLVLAGVVLVAHVGLDRVLGYGLKYPSAFTDTHLGVIGRARARGAEPAA